MLRWTESAGKPSAELDEEKLNQQADVLRPWRADAGISPHSNVRISNSKWQVSSLNSMLLRSQLVPRERHMTDMRKYMYLRYV